MENIKKNVDYSPNIKTYIIVCHAISIITNLTLFLIFYMTEHYFKYFGLFLHFLLFIVGIISTLFLFSKEQNNKNLKKYKSSIRYFSFIIHISFLFYLSLLIYMYLYKYDIDIFHLFAISIIIWGVFHFFLISVTKSYIGEVTKKSQYGKRKNDKLKEIL